MSPAESAASISGVELGRRFLLELGVRCAAYGGADENESSHSTGIGEGEIDGRLTTHRARDDHRPIQASRVQNRQRIADG